jgi:GH35 family endo-1,4-beta-xylanase
MMTALMLLGLAQGATPLADTDLTRAIGPRWRFSQVQAERLPGKDGRPSMKLQFAPAAGAQPWDAVVHHPNDAAIREGDVVVFSAQAKSDSYSRIGVNYEQASEPHTKFLTQVVLLSPVWKEIRFAGKAPRNFASGEAQLSLFLGYGKGSVELANLQVVNLGQVDLAAVKQTLEPYGGAKNPDTWRAAARARIERIRKNDLTVRVVDSEGRPVRNASVRVNQTRHAFHFGTAAPVSRILGESEDDAKFRETLVRLFNTVTFENDLKWNSLVERNPERIDSAIDWLRSRDLAVRAHNLVWGSYRWLPSELRDASAAESRRLVEERVRTAARRYRGRVYLWDVVNEAVSETDLWEKAGWDLFSDTFRWAREEDPDARLCYNDYNITEEAQVGPGHRLKAIELVKKLKADGAPVDVIGIQAHVSTPITPTVRVLEILDDLAKVVPHLEITEYDLGLADDKVHGEHMRDFLTACFSHPAVDGFVVWGFWEGSHWRAAESAAMFRRDWTARPAAMAWEDLVKRQWWTKASAPTNARGEARFRPFLGAHRVEVSLGDRQVVQTVDVGKGGKRTLTVTLP